jgi:hypothetical protein
MATRRTHIVRIGTDTNRYIDIEVLDAVSFKTKSGKEMTLNLPGAQAVPYIVDNTGDNNGKSTLNATRRSHMKQITSTTDATQIVDVEVLDAIAFKDDQGKEWIMNLPDDGSLSVYNTTTGAGPTNSTRRVHDEKIYSDPTDKTSDYMTVERCDTMCFRTTNGDEMIIEMPSYDDGSNTGRADSITTPANYDPTTTAVVPPQNTDPSVYAFFPAASKGAMTHDQKIACGPLWWPRGMSKKGGPWYQYTPVQQPYEFSLYTDNGVYIWVGNPADSSFAGTPPSYTWQRLPNVSEGYDNGSADSIGRHTPGPPLPEFGFASLDDAIQHGALGQDWGVLDFTDSRIDSGAPNGLNANYCIPGVSGTPDIWQLAGVAPPALVPPPNPTGKWTAGAQSSAIQKQVALAYLACWNGTSQAWNDEMAAAAITVADLWWYITWPGGSIQRFGNGTGPANYSYPDTSFHVPLPNELVNPPQTAGTFLGGLDPGFWTGNWGNVGFSLPAYATLIGVAQLDPLKWDTTSPEAPKLRNPPPSP